MVVLEGFPEAVTKDLKGMWAMQSLGKTIAGRRPTEVPRPVAEACPGCSVSSEEACGWRGRSQGTAVAEFRNTLRSQGHVVPSGPLRIFAFYSE